MGLFSSPAPLDQEIQAHINPMWTQSEVGKDYRSGLSKVAGSQEAIRSSLRAGEYLKCITPCFTPNTGYDGLLVVTSDRVMKVKGSRIQGEMRLADVANVKQLVHRVGYFLLQIISRNAAPFAAFAGDQSGSQGNRKFWEGTIQVPLGTEDLMDFVVLTIRSSGQK